MNFDEMMNAYLKMLQDAGNMDETAGRAARKGDRTQASELYTKAAALYARAAAHLLDMMEMADGAEGEEYQRSVDRLIAASEQMKKKAESVLSTAEAAPRGARTGGISSNDEEEDGVVFAPAAEMPQTRFDQIAGLSEAKQMVAEEIIRPILYADVYRKFGRKNRGGLLLFGPPGGGKTMLARAIAAESGLAFFSVRCSDIVGRYFGEAEKRVRALFNAARRAKDAVIFLDEAEALACRRGGNSMVMNRLVPELLSQMDGFEQFEGHMIVIFATNRPYDLDPAFLRPGRLATHCYIPLPDLEIRKSLLEKQIKSRPHDEGIRIEELARETERFSCADLVNVVDRGCQKPINREIDARKGGNTDPQELLTEADLRQALRQVHPSVEMEEIRRLEKWMRQMGIHFMEAA